MKKKTLCSVNWRPVKNRYKRRTSQSSFSSKRLKKKIHASSKKRLRKTVHAFHSLKHWLLNCAKRQLSSRVKTWSSLIKWWKNSGKSDS
jgi:hypothetical protein